MEKIMSREIDNIRSEMQRLYADGIIKCSRGFFEDLDKLAAEAGECIDSKERNSANFALHKLWDRAGIVIGLDPETENLYRKIWGLILRYRSW
jgi:hypothetical protein